MSLELPVSMPPGQLSMTHLISSIVPTAKNDVIGQAIEMSLELPVSMPPGQLLMTRFISSIVHTTKNDVIGQASHYPANTRKLRPISG